MCLTLHPARYVEGPVAGLNRESELTDYRRLSSYLVAARRRGRKGASMKKAAAAKSAIAVPMRSMRLMRNLT
jgi:hypothetical protein